MLSVAVHLYINIVAIAESVFVSRLNGSANPKVPGQIKHREIVIKTYL